MLKTHSLRVLRLGSTLSLLFFFLFRCFFLFTKAQRKSYRRAYAGRGGPACSIAVVASPLPLFKLGAISFLLFSFFFLFFFLVLFFFFEASSLIPTWQSV